MNALLKRFPVVWAARNRIRGSFFGFLRHLAATDDARELFSDMLRLNNVSSGPQELATLGDHHPPYSELGWEQGIAQTRERDDIVFITGRFRSGSTLLWNLFRNIPSVTAYYEPFNERRWFESGFRGGQVDSSHLNVSEYWSEYKDLEILANYYNEAWVREQLYMDARSWNPSMQRYIEIMIEHSKGRPVLQFNRVDFRLPWLRVRFPKAKIVHIVRHPRDQWCSTLMDMHRFPKDLKLAEFEPFDEFYLLPWGRDLSHYFPFLTLDNNSHPYELFYQIWRISFCFGCIYSDFSISFEELLRRPAALIQDMCHALLINDADLEVLVPLVMPVPTKWRRYASHEWFARIESKVDETFANYLA